MFSSNDIIHGSIVHAQTRRRYDGLFLFFFPLPRRQRPELTFEMSDSLSERLGFLSANSGRRSGWRRHHFPINEILGLTLVTRIFVQFLHALNADNPLDLLP